MYIVNHKPMKTVSERNRGFDSLRGILALLVIIGHLDYIRAFFGFVNVGVNPLIYHLGRISVSGFFVLSGFLITRNLLKLHNSNLPRLKKFRLFYLKRMLRILPLYYTIILLSFYILPHIEALHYPVPPSVRDARIEAGTSGYYYLLIPQIALANNIVLPFAEPTWSIGVEEIFYICMPLFLFLIPFKKNWLLYSAAAFVGVKIGYWFFVPSCFNDRLFAILLLCRFECILIGCYAGYLYYEKNKLINHLKRKHAYYALFLILIFACLMGLKSFLYIHFSVCFAIIILLVAKEKFRFLNNKPLAFIGKISFSLYLVHEIAIVLILNIKSLSTPSRPSSPLVYILVVVCALPIAWLFYKLVEEPFLRLKEKIDSQQLGEIKNTPPAPELFVE